MPCMRSKRPASQHEVDMENRCALHRRDVAGEPRDLVEAAELALKVALLLEVIVCERGVFERPLAVEDRATDLFGAREEHERGDRLFALIKPHKPLASAKRERLHSQND